MYLDLERNGIQTRPRRMRVGLLLLQGYIQIEIVSVNTRGGKDRGPPFVRAAVCASSAERNYFATLSLCFIL